MTSKSITADKRFLCVDALRGIDMLWIIGGGEAVVALARAYPGTFLDSVALQFSHEWGVFRFYDIIMPLFLFLVGVVMPVAFKKRIARGETRRSIYKHIIKRVGKLYILGLIASGYLLQFNIRTLHLWTDTLHAIAAGYLISSVLILESEEKWQIIITALLLLIYWLIMTFVPVPGYGAGIFEKDLNLALYIDDKVLGRFAEGSGWTYMLTNMTFACSVMLGVFAGRILLSDLHNEKKIMWMIIIGAACLSAGKIWSNWFPIIHHLWTSSMVLFSGGISFLLLGLFFWIIDVCGFRKWTLPFRVIGVNAIAVYVATRLFDFKLIGNVIVGGLARWLYPLNEFIHSMAALVIVWLILYWMYRKKTFINL